MQLWRYRWAIILVPLALLLLAGFLLNSAFEPETLESGRREVEVLRNEPILGFRAPGTELRGQVEQPAQVQPFGGGQTPSVVELSFDMTGEPGDAVEAYRQVAQTMGWTWVTEGCSRTEKATGAVFAKTVAGFDATLVVRVRLPPGGPEEARTGALTVTLLAQAAGGHELEIDVGLHRSDVHCLQGLDPSDADLQEPNSETSSEELCARIPVSEARAIFPDVVGVEPLVVSGCLWVDGSGQPVFMVEQAYKSRAYYEDRRLSGPEISDQFFYFSVHGREDPELDRALWVPAPGGPFVVDKVGLLDHPPPGEDPLLGIARLLAESEAPLHTVAPTTSVERPPESAELIYFLLDGGIAGNRAVTVTEDGVAVYERGIAEPIRFKVPPFTMAELRAALSQVSFADLSSSYGSHAGPDAEAKVLRYRGKTVRVWSNGPPELRALTAVLTRVLEQGRANADPTT
ncbi:MAG TPA: hypothetical protein VGR26_00795 [Acidimicrobiales bacterium]|nr:hypothetical protein [Acidimicrobiales bacterium]